MLREIDWSTSVAILERIIRYEAVHEIRDWEDLPSRIEPENRCCYAFFHPSLADEPLIFVEVALTNEIPSGIGEILGGGASAPPVNGDFTTAVFYSISNCQPGLKRISLGNFLIKQVVRELQVARPSIKIFVTLSPVPGLGKWLEREEDETDETLAELKSEFREKVSDRESAAEQEELLRKLAFNFLLRKRRGSFPADSVARFHLGNGASLYRVNAGADRSDKGWRQSRGVMVNYLYDQKRSEAKRLGRSGVRPHMLNHAGLAAFELGNAVVVISGAGIHVHRLVDSGFEVGLGGLPGQIGAGDFHLQGRIVRHRSHDIIVFCVHGLLTGVATGCKDTDVHRTPAPFQEPAAQAPGFPSALSGAILCQSHNKLQVYGRSFARETPACGSASSFPY